MTTSNGRKQPGVGPYTEVRDFVSKAPTGQTVVDGGQFTHNELHLIMAAISLAEAAISFDENESVESLMWYAKARRLVGGERFTTLTDKIEKVHAVAASIDGTLD